MSAISAQEWATMTPVERRREIGNMTQAQAVELYAGLASDEKRGPRLNRSEWTALGRTGQQQLLGLLPDWEIAILNSWGVTESCILEASPAVPIESGAAVEGWSRKTMYALLFWSLVLPPVALLLFLFNFWRPSRLGQSIGLLAAGAISFCAVYPSLCHMLLSRMG